jgi:hypothetical protein
MKYLMTALFALMLMVAPAIAGSPSWNLSIYVCSVYSDNVVTGAGDTTNCLELSDEEKEDYMEDLVHQDSDGDDDDDDDDDSDN